ncbi:HAD family hydrolase [Arthrobacter sp. JSM 101049]|uniref:HAD family hydrolase n=1 Tax=Arthrobacter sp. JSM 101049 TaxID=929097 RepID=UPI0035622667
MARIPSVHTLHDGDWYLFDYGMVISDAPAAADWDRLHEATGRPMDDAGSTYWAHRHAFDAGSLESTGYWAAVLDRAVEAAEAERLDRLDARLWSRLNPRTVEVLQALQARGSHLALLSNMPVRMSEIFTAEATWSAFFERLFFSGPLGLGKPDRRIYEHVLRELGVDGSDVVFIDDKSENIEAARELGLRAVHHVPGIDLAAELGL